MKNGTGTIHRGTGTSKYVEPAIGWNEEDEKSGVAKFGVSEYAPVANLKVQAPVRPASLAPPDPELALVVM